MIKSFFGIKSFLNILGGNKQKNYFFDTQIPMKMEDQAQYSPSNKINNDNKKSKCLGTSKLHKRKRKKIETLFYYQEIHIFATYHSTC